MKKMVNDYSLEIVSGKLTGMLRNYCVSYETLCDFWRELGGTESYGKVFPKDEADISQVLAVTANDGRQWLYAPNLSAIYGGADCKGILPEDFEFSANILLASRIAMFAKQSFSHKKFVFDNADVTLIILDGELIGIGNSEDECWLDMEDLIAKPKEEFEKKIERYKRFAA